MTMTYPSSPAPGAKTVTAHNGDQITYSVDADAPFTINAWNAATPNPDNAPFWHQPHDLQGNAWPDQATAQAFADAWINEHFVTPPAPVAPTAPTPEQIAAAQTVLSASGYVVTPPATPPATPAQ